MSALKQLTVRHFRGATNSFELRFAAGKKLTVIYGENGSGKSTICDALEYRSRGTVGSLDNRGLGATARYWPALGSAAGDISVTLETEDGPVAEPRVEVFRRSQILSLIEATPGERYAAISRFVDVSGVEASEGALREVIRNLDKQHDGAAARLKENEIMIGQFWETAGRPDPDAFSWAESECAKRSDSVDAEISAIRALQTAYSRLVDLPARLRTVQQASVTAKSAAETAESKMKESLQTVSKDAAEVVSVLEAARAFLIKNPNPEACPVCESSDEIEDLPQRVNARLEAFSSLQLVQSQVIAAAQAVQRAEQQLQLVRENARLDADKFEAARAAAGLPSDISLPSTPVPNSASALTAWLNTNASLTEEWKKAESLRHDRKQFVNTLKQALDTWRVNRAAMEDLDRLLPRLERALTIVEEERRRFTDDLLAAIAADVSRLYDIVHPGEGLDKIRLELDPKKRASLEIGANFGGQPTRPQAYFSESHLDTLGLCVLLALAALDDPENTIVVLDDVLASVDDVHSDRLLKLLQSESRRFLHFIITTHYRPWKNKAGSDYQFIELAPWSLESGVTLV